MRITDIMLVLLACILFLAIVVVSDYEKMPEGGNKSLKQFLADDLTSLGVYDWDDHHCVHFSIALTENLTAAGYNATPAILATSRPGEWSHMVVSVNLGNETVYVESQTDEIFPLSDWDDEIGLGDEVEYVNISVARSMRG